MTSESENSDSYSKTNAKSLIFDYRIQVLLAIVLCVVVLAGWRIRSLNWVSTDNAIIRCEMVDVASEVNGIIEKILFEDNELVNKGQLIVKIRDDYFRAGVNKAQSELESSISNYESALEKNRITEIESKGNAKRSTASLETTTSNLSSILLESEEAKAKLKVANKNFEFLKEDFTRISQLYEKKIVSKRQYQEAKRAYESSLAERDALQANQKSILSKFKTEKFRVTEADVSNDIALESVNGLIAVANAEVREAKSSIELAKAELDLATIYLNRTNIKALRTGHITNRKLSEGEFVEIGQPIASITSCVEKAWIEANFKETQIGRVIAGQKVQIKVDAYPDLIFEGKVIGISSGSGATFSVLPPENAVGNFTKVVQRFPIKISINNDNGVMLRMGMSTVVTIMLDS